jgi:hypothetical protein
MGSGMQFASLIARRAGDLLGGAPRRPPLAHYPFGSLHDLAASRVRERGERIVSHFAN